MRTLEARLPELRRWARRYAIPGTSADDLVAWAVLGVLEAGVENDRRFGRRARGAMLDALRRERGPRATVETGEALPAPLWTDDRWEARRALRRLCSAYPDLDDESRRWLVGGFESPLHARPRTPSGRSKQTRRIRARLARACGVPA